jgi:hypothetical protein
MCDTSMNLYMASEDFRMLLLARVRLLSKLAARGVPRPAATCHILCVTDLYFEIDYSRKDCWFYPINSKALVNAELNQFCTHYA